MKQRLIKMIAFCLLSFLALPVMAQTQPATMSQQEALTVSQLVGEIRKLKLEMVQQGIEIQNWKIKQLEREAQQLANERQQAEEQLQSLYTKAAVLAQQSDAAIAPESDSAMEAEDLKAKLNGHEAKSLPARHQSLLQREADLKEQLEKEQRRLRELLKKAKA